jgi:acetyl-CoA acetyltransferase/uncharacterized OB-fold protein
LGARPVADPVFRDAVLVGAFQTPYSRQPVKEALDLLTDAVAGILRSHGIALSQLDGLAASSFQLAPDNVVTLAERLGASPAWTWQGAQGGASGVMSVIEGARAITDGRADTVVAVAGDSFDVGRHMQLMDEFNTGMRDYLAPYAFGGTNGLFALVEREHRELYGTRREQLAAFAVTQRANAALNPNALLRTPLTTEDYLTARLIADPIRLYDCVLPCTGADAVLLMSRARAADLGLAGITIRSGRSRNNHLPLEPLSLRTGAEEFAARLFDEAGVEHADLDFAQLYDDYPIMELIQLEDLGFAKKGEGGHFVESTDISRSGTLPVNTGGGQLSCGQSGAGGGMIGMVEAVLQLLGQAGQRQLANPRLGLVSGFGMVGYGKGLSSAAVILSRATAGTAGPSGWHADGTQETPLGITHQYQALLASGQAAWARCADCGRAHFYPRPYCPHCLSDAVRIEPVSAAFRVRSFTWVHRPQRPSASGLPVLLIAGEADGVTIIAEGSGWAGGTCQIGATACLVIGDDQRRVPVFAPAGQAGPE